ncbi:arginine exporter protein ArgO [Microbacterium testaceum]|uniref:hypothetical protein n=1 Tax=Microbacterium TaxID=33882 RepID=UPI002789DB39|nr:MULTISPECIES: hypothetical protein [Microbacterium]MDQ1111190.1 arginine exporter protein ArgO [Microbacterium testaceum]MDR6098270.1 arginine exporter protein ArgO [Microbacterium sp. SORGH_AS_0454]
MIAYLAVYGVAALVYLLFCLGGLLAPRPQEQRTAARWAFAAPVWPAAIVWLLVLGVRGLWRTAAFEGWAREPRRGGRR